MNIGTENSILYGFFAFGAFKPARSVTLYLVSHFAGVFSASVKFSP